MQKIETQVQQLFSKSTTLKQCKTGKKVAL